MSYRKNVFVIGAGVSAHMGAPLMGNFLEVAREILDRGSLRSEEAKRFQNVIQYWIEHDLTEKAAKLKLSNLEDLFGLVDLNLRVDPRLAPVRRDMIFMILRTLEERITAEWAGSCYADAPGSSVRQVSIMRQFVDIVARRWDSAPSSVLVQDSIISTNYDVLIEQALTQAEMEADYALPDHNPSTKAKVMVKLLKLHGSANWSICPECNHVKVHPPGTQIATVEAASCKCGHYMEPFIVPPTWSKGERRAALQSVWKAAFDELLEARRWVFIGSSLPETDKFLRYLFGLALQHNPKLDRIVIIDPNPCGYDDLFQNRASKISFEHLSQARFQEAIQQPMLQRALGQAPYRQGNPLW